MRLWMRACGAVLSVGIAVAAGCGGNVLVDGTGGGEGGQGGTSGSGTPPGVTNGQTTTTNVTSVSSVSATSVSTGSEMSTGTGTSPLCDNQGDCGTIDEGCIGCAVAGPCEQSYNACFDGAECSDYSECISQCGDDECYQKCFDAFPLGAQLYSDLVTCVICVECYDDCDGAASGCP